MDDQGRPQISRELLLRMTRDQSQQRGSVDDRALSAHSQKSFDERKQLENNRSRVRAYRDSILGRGNLFNGSVSAGEGAGYGRRKPRKFNVPNDHDISQKISSGQNRPSAGFKEPQSGAGSGQNRPSAGFKEPPSRDYNPYG